MIDFRAIVGDIVTDPDSYVRRIQESIKAEWENQASRVMSAESLAEYAASLGFGDVNGAITGATVELSGTPANVIEQGVGPGGVGTQGIYDQRKTLLRSKKAKRGKRGMYMHVPVGDGMVRTVSEGGKPWITKGVKARNIARKVAEAIPDLLESIR